MGLGTPRHYCTYSVQARGRFHSFASTKPDFHQFNRQRDKAGTEENPDLSGCDSQTRLDFVRIYEGDGAN